ncbi:hypothetical protein GGI35DRAFT_295273 [Trichoderma velutinum]
MRIGMARFLLLLSFPFVFLSFLICGYLFFLQLREATYPPQPKHFLSFFSLSSLFLCVCEIFPSFIGHSTYFFFTIPVAKSTSNQNHCTVAGYATVL